MRVPACGDPLSWRGSVGRRAVFLGEVLLKGSIDDSADETCSVAEVVIERGGLNPSGSADRSSGNGFDATVRGCLESGSEEP
ncbi:hypothetical protein [Deinococcus sp. UYEF24]